LQRRMSNAPDLVNYESVLLDTGGLRDAHRRASDSGKRQIDGLYHAGQKVQEVPASFARDVNVRDAEARKEQNFGRIAKVHQAKHQHRRKKSDRLGKSEEELADEESAKKAKGILEKATENEKLLYNGLFDFFDVDADRTWGTIEFAQRMTDIGCNTSVESAANLLYFAGVRDVDRITYNDFIQMMPKLKAFRILLEKDAMRAFASQDDGSGFLTRHALRDVVRVLAGPEGIDEETVHYIVKKSDRERTGRIPFAFFIRALFGTPPVLVYTPKPRKTNFLARLFGCGSAGKPAENNFDDVEDTRY